MLQPVSYQPAPDPIVPCSAEFRSFPHIRCEDDDTDVHKQCGMRHGSCTGRGACGLNLGHGGSCQCSFCGGSF